MNNKKLFFKLIFLTTASLHADPTYVIQSGANFMCVNIYSGQEGTTITTTAHNAPQDHSKIENKSTNDQKTDQKTDQDATQKNIQDADQTSTQQNVQDTQQTTAQVTEQENLQIATQDTEQKNSQEASLEALQRSLLAADQIAEQENKNKTDVPVLQTSDQKTMQQTRVTSSQTEQGNGFLSNGRFKYIAGGCLASIGALVAVRALILHQTACLVKNKQAWCNWKDELSFQELLQESHQTLWPELLKNIKATHVNPRHADDHIYAVTHFLQAIAHETHILKRYIVLRKIEHALQVDRVFHHKDISAAAMQRLNKLAYLKTLFFSWAKAHHIKRAIQTI